MTNKEIAEIVHKSDVYLPRIFWLAFSGNSSFQEFVDFLDEMPIEEMKKLSPDFETYVRDTFGKSIEDLEDPQFEFENHLGMVNKSGFLAEVRMPKTTNHEFEDIPEGTTPEPENIIIVDGKALVGIEYKSGIEHSGYIYGEDATELLAAMEDFQKKSLLEDIEIEKRNK